jgi:hypothetical protein
MEFFHNQMVGRERRLIAAYGSKTMPGDPAIVAAIERAGRAASVVPAGRPTPAGRAFHPVC